MTGRSGRDEKPLYQAIIDAQKLAFAPLAFHATLALRDLGILAALAECRPNGLTAEQIAGTTRLPLYGVKVLLESGVVSELIALDGDRFSLRQLGLLVLRDPMTRVNMDFAADVCYRGMAHLRETVTSGKPMGLREFGPWKTIYEGLTQLPEQTQRSWLAFDHYYSDNMFPNALPLLFADPPKRLLDVGANTGKFALACLEHNPQVQVSLLDFPGQLELARQAIEAKGHSARASYHAIDFLNPTLEFPGNQDAIWMSQFLDCFSEDEIVSILERARRALAPGGRIYIVETYWDNQEHAAARFVLTMTTLYFACLANGNSKMYLADDMRKCVQRAGLTIDRELERFSASHTMFVCRAS